MHEMSSVRPRPVKRTPGSHTTAHGDRETTDWLCESWLMKKTQNEFAPLWYGGLGARGDSGVVPGPDRVYSETRG